MKWLVIIAVIAGVLYFGAGQIHDFVESGRGSVDARMAKPVRDLAAAMDQTQATVARANQRIADSAAQAAGSSASVHAGTVRAELDQLRGR